MEINLKIGPYRLYRRTEYSKTQIFDSDGNDITNTNIGIKILDDYKAQIYKSNDYFIINDDILNHYEKNNKIKNVFIPDSVRAISTSTFEHNNFRYIHLPDKLKYIEKRAFLLCENLKEISFPDAFEGAFDDHVFALCTRLEKINLPSCITKIPESTFDECRALNEIKLPKSLIKIEKRAFRQCTSLKNIILPDTISEIDDYAFQYCAGLEKINIPHNLEKLGSCVFEYSGLKELIFNHDLPHKDTIYYSDCFHNTQINKIVINNTVNFIDPTIFSEIHKQIKTIEYLGTKEEFKLFSKSNHKLLKLLKYATIKISNESLDNIIKNNKNSYVDKIKNIFVER